MATLDGIPIQTLPAMNLRIQHLESIWGGVQLRLSCGRDPREDADFRELLSHPPPRLERQTNRTFDEYAEELDTMLPLDCGDYNDFEFPPPPRGLFRMTNRHELLTEAARIRYWDARTKDERDAIMIEEGFGPDA